MKNLKKSVCFFIAALMLLWGSQMLATAATVTAGQTNQPPGATAQTSDAAPQPGKTVESQMVNHAVVPEPVRLAAGVFVVMLLALAGLRWAWRT